MTATAPPLTKAKWLATAGRTKVSTCDVCGRDRDDDGKRLVVVRVDGGRLFRCFDCATNPPRRPRVTATAPRTKPAMPDPPAAPDELVLMPIDKLVAAKDNPRRNVGDVAELADSIKAQGLIEPIIATQSGTGRYVIVAGARRHAAAKLAGLTGVPTIVRSLTDAQRVEAMLVENLQREDLAPLEEASTYKRLIDEFGLTQRQLTERIGISQGQISKRMQLLDLPKPIQTALDSARITLADATQLLQLKNMPKRLDHAFREGVQHGDVPRYVSSQMHAHELEQTIASAKAELAMRGVTVIDRDKVYSSPNVIRLDGWEAQELRIKPAAHAKLPCHGAYVDAHSGAIVQLCTNRRSHKPGDAATIKPEDQKARERAEREAEKRKQLRARETNIKFGVLLAEKLASPAIDTTNMRLIAELVLLHTGGELAQAGTRYVDEASQTVVTKKDGSISSIKYQDARGSAELLAGKLQAATTPEEIMGVLLQALLAAKYADTNAVPQSDRYHHVRGLDNYGSAKITSAVGEIGKTAGVVTIAARKGARQA